MLDYRAMTITLVRFAMLGCCWMGLLSACGSGGDDDDSIQQLTCSFTNDDGTFDCTEYRGDRDFLGRTRNRCIRLEATIVEGGTCPRAGLTGICSFEDGTVANRFFYYDVADEVDVLEMGCTESGGVWSTS